MNKIWIAGSVSQYGEEENIRELVKTFKYFDGAYFNVNYNEGEISLSSDTFDMLSAHKGKGRIVWTPWLQRHDWAMNAFLHMVPLGDWFLAIDAQELPKEPFLHGMRDLVDRCEKNNVGSVWWNRPYLIKKREGMLYLNNPHCWPINLGDQCVNIADETIVTYDEGGVHFGNFIYNKKKKENTMLLHGVKYSLYPPPNNQFSMFYRNEKELQEHENKRRWFCSVLSSHGYALNLQGLEEFFRSPHFDNTIREYLNYEFVFRDFYRYKILKHTLDEIMQSRYNYKICMI